MNGNNQFFINPDPRMQSYLEHQGFYLWDQIDREVSSLSEYQKNEVLNNPNYINIYNQLQEIVQKELLLLVKGKIENSYQGQQLLQQQLSVLKQLKQSSAEKEYYEMETFKKFKEKSANNPSLTYEEFIKNETTRNN